MKDFTKLGIVADQYRDLILDWALVLAAVATITMALIELAKVLLKARPKFHRTSVLKWVDSGNTYEQLMMLAIGGGGTSTALFDQPTNKMMGQIQAAANTALDFPQRYPAFYNFLCAQPGTDDSTRDEVIWANFCARVEDGEKLDPESAETAAAVSAATRARARLDHFVARRLDAFQTVTEYRWARWNQGISVIGATALLMAMFVQIGQLGPRTFIASIFGGMIAPLAKDVVSALSDLRARRM